MVDLQYCGRCTCVTQRTEPDGSEGTLTVKWSNGEETLGCMVKNDDTFRELTGNTVTEETEYYAYTRILSENSNKADISVHRFTKPRNKECTVNLNKKVRLSNHEYMFVPCEHSKFNSSCFLKKYSLSVTKNLSPREVCIDGKVMGLCKERNPERLLKFLDFEINKESNSDRFYIKENIFDKLEETGPLLIGRGESKTLSLVGYYGKQSTNHINIFTFGTDTETIDVFRQTHRAALPRGNENPTIDDLPAPPQNNENSQNVPRPEQDVDQSDLNPSGLRSQENYKKKLPPGFSLDDDISKVHKRQYRRYLLYIAQNGLIENWRQVGQYLKIEDPKLEEIRRDYSGQVKEQAYQMLVAWIASSKNPRLGTLLDALERVGLKQLVDAINIKGVLNNTTETPEESHAVTNDQILDMEKEIKDDWKFIGRYLELEDHTINEIAENCHDMCDKTHRMLVKWQQQQGKAATIEVLIRALRDAGKKNVAGYLQDKLSQQST